VRTTLDTHASDVTSSTSIVTVAATEAIHGHDIMAHDFNSKQKVRQFAFWR
jgi:GTP cyclohydrolase FolE2